MKYALAACLLLLIPALPAHAASSDFSKLDLDKGCHWDKQPEEEEGMGNCGWCDGYKGLEVRFCEGDLRQSLGYGPVDADNAGWNSFGQFNHVNTTIEWRLEDGEPFATIHRWFIENANPENGIPDKTHEGQVLVISTIATAANPVSCPVGYVDARANSNANELAQQVADTMARNFACGSDKPAFHGERGTLAGDPTNDVQ